MTDDLSQARERRTTPLDENLTRLLDEGHSITLTAGGETLEGNADSPAHTWWGASVTIHDRSGEPIINVVSDNPTEALTEAVTNLTHRHQPVPKEPHMELTGRLISTWKGERVVTELSAVDPDYFKREGTWTVTGWTTPTSPGPGGSRLRLRLEISDGTVLEGEGHVDSMRMHPIDAGPRPRRLVIRINV